MSVSVPWNEIKATKKSEAVVLRSCTCLGGKHRRKKSCNGCCMCTHAHSNQLSPTWT